MAFHAKDALFVIDDLVMEGNKFEAQKMQKEAGRLLRAQGNNSARSRMRADTTLRPDKPPRGLILATGEDLWNGQSVRARMIVIEVGPAAMMWDRLSEAQRQARTGVLAGTMSGFIGWLAQDPSRRLLFLAPELIERHLAACSGFSHRRTPRIIAHLMLGWELFLLFAHEAGALSPEDHDQLRQRGGRCFTSQAPLRPSIRSTAIRFAASWHSSPRPSPAVAHTLLVQTAMHPQNPTGGAGEGNTLRQSRAVTASAGLRVRTST